jgi:hypothetical protein
LIESIPYQALMPLTWQAPQAADRHCPKPVTNRGYLIAVVQNDALIKLFAAVFP